MAPDLLTDQGVVKALLTEIGVRPQKRFGQNFLVDQHVVAEIRDHIASKNPDVVVEIGPGLGAVTQALIDMAPLVIAVEIDKRLARSLETRLGSHANLEVRTCDILNFDFQQEFAGKSVTVFGSLPYRITAPILKHLVRHRSVITDACLITQREVAEKIAHSPGRQGSSLGVFVRSYAEVAGLRRIGKTSFHPVPEVESEYWEMRFLSGPRFACDEGAFFTVVRTLYGNRRKMVRRALQDIIPADSIHDVLASADIDGTSRGEVLTFPELDRLAIGCLPYLTCDGLVDDDS